MEMGHTGPVDSRGCVGGGRSSAVGESRVAPKGGRPEADECGGQVTPLVAIVVVVVGVMAMFAGRDGGAAVPEARAATAADAAALAGAAEGRDAAESMAEANGAELVAWVVDGAEVEVEVTIGDASARARAEQVGPPPGAGGGEAPQGLSPGLVAAIDRAEALLGAPVPIVSGWRSPAEQEALWRNRATNGYPVARPGTSKHELGLAIDVPRSFVPRLLVVGAAAGLCHPLPDSDPIHFVLCGRSPPG